MSATPERIARDFMNWKARYSDRDLRHHIMSEVLAGHFEVLDPDEEEVTNRSANLIQVALEDTAESAALIPTVRGVPTKGGETPKKKARLMERVGTAMLQANKIDLYIPKAVMDLGAFGLVATTIMPDFKERRVRIEKRDPRYCYPDPGYRVGDELRRCAFARDIYWSQLPLKYQMKLQYLVSQVDERVDFQENTEIQLIEYFDENEIVTVAAIQGAKITYDASTAASTNYIPIELERWEHMLGVCPVVVEGRITFDGEFRGQFDQVTDILAEHVRLQGLMIDYADQAVYSDIWVRDLVGKMPYGGGAYIELGPNGAIGRVPPAVSSLDVSRDLQALQDAIHLGGRWPKARPGEIDQSQASAKFLETSAGLMNTALRTYHQILSRNFEKILQVAFAMEKHFFAGEKRPANGVLANQEFLIEYDPADFDDSVALTVEYGLGLGRDPSNSAVLHIQYAKEGYISKEFVQENIDGLRDIGREQARLDLQDLVAMMKSKLLQGVEAGTIPDRALVEIAKDRGDGKTITELFEEYVVKPAEEQQEQGIPSGLGGLLSPGALPGGPPGPGGPGAGPGPGGPPGAGPMPPPAPGGADLLARMNQPAGPGGTLGTQVKTNG